MYVCILKSLVFQVKGTPKTTPSAAPPCRLRLRKTGSASYTEYSDADVSPEKAALNEAFREQYEEDAMTGDPNFKPASSEDSSSQAGSSADEEDNSQVSKVKSYYPVSPK